MGTPGWIALGVGVALFLLSIALPTPRRLWVAEVYAAKHIGAWLLDLVGIRRLVARARGREHVPLTRPRLARRYCEDMGPTYIKLGQIIASSAGLFPKPYVEEFRKCLDRVRPFSYEEVEIILGEELGHDWRTKLVELDPRPLASASIAQVHTAKLADGTAVVVKVQRPGIQSRVRADMRIIRQLARVAAVVKRDAELANPVGVVEDFSETLRQELDFRLEADNLARFNDIMRELGHGDVRAPFPHKELTTPRVLVMERFFGLRVDDIEGIREKAIDAESMLLKGLRAWFQTVLFHGFFHGDVHAGNLMMLDDGSAGFLDFGIVGRFDQRQRDMITDYLIAFSTGNYDALADVIIAMSRPEQSWNKALLVKDLETAYSPMLRLSFGELNYAEILPEIQRVASKHRMRLPQEFVLITKQMLYFDRYAKLLAPDLNVFTDPRLVMSMMGDIMTARAQRSDGAAQATAPGAPDEAEAEVPTQSATVRG